MKKKTFKRGTSLFLALLMCFSTMLGLGTTAYAAGEQAEVYMIGFPRDGDANYSGEWGHPDLNYIIITYKRCARDKPDDRTATSQRERCQSLYDRM